MSANLLRNLTISFGVLAFLCLGVLAYGRYQANNLSTEAAACGIQTNNSNAEMPWESLTRQLLGAVAL